VNGYNPAFKIVVRPDRKLRRAFSKADNQLDSSLNLGRQKHVMLVKKILVECVRVTKETIVSPLNPPVKQESNRLKYGIFSLSILSMMSGLF
jgi:hypothetical protein